MPKKIMMVLPPRNFDGRAYQTIRRALESRGHKVAVSSIVSGAVSPEDDGESAPVDVRIHEIKTYEYDAFIFVGGEGARFYYDDDRVRQLVKDVKYKTIGATGNAAVILALAEALNGKKVTCPPECADLVIRQGGVFTGQPFEVDEKVITLRDSSVAEHFANAVAKALE